MNHKRKVMPSYYEKFMCIAGKCSITCCREWKISVDPDTCNKWEKTSVGKNAYCQLAGSASHTKRTLSSFITKKEGEKVIGLLDNNNCPFLNEGKLCNLVIEFGDDILSHTCKIFPRQIHEFEGRVEYSLVSCCPVVVDFWKNPETIDFHTIGNEVSPNNKMALQEEELFKLRDEIINIIGDKNHSIEKSLLTSFYILLNGYNGEKSVTSKEFFELLDDIQFDDLDRMEESNELFLDIVENYRKQNLYKGFLDDISDIAEKLSIESDEDIIDDFKKEFKTFENIMRNYLMSEIFTNLFIPDTGLEQMVIMMQWIAMEFVAIRQALFLKWILSAGKEIEYEAVRECIVIVSRMTGYDQEDIVEYMEESFRNAIWDWGYFALIVGK